MATKVKGAIGDRRVVKKKTSIGGNKGRISRSMLGKNKQRDYKAYHRQGK